MGFETPLKKEEGMEEDIVAAGAPRPEDVERLQKEAQVQEKIEETVDEEDALRFLKEKPIEEVLTKSLPDGPEQPEEESLDVPFRETKKELLERKKQALAEIAEKGGTRIQRETLQKEIQLLEKDIEKHREEKLRLFKERPKRGDVILEVEKAKNLRKLQKDLKQVFSPERKTMRHLVKEIEQEESKIMKRNWFTRFFRGSRFQQLEKMRVRELEAAEKREFREKQHRGDYLGAEEAAKKSLSRKEAERLIEERQGRLDDLGEKANAWYEKGGEENMGKATALTKEMERLSQDLEQIKRGAWMVRKMDKIHEEAVEVDSAFKESQDELTKYTIWPKFRSYDLLTGGVSYWSKLLYRYIKYRKPRIEAHFLYEAEQSNYKKINRELLFKLIQKITGEKNFGVAYERMKLMAKDYRYTKEQKRLLREIVALYEGVENLRFKDRFARAFIEKMGNRPLVTFEQVSGLVRAAKKVGLYE